MRLNRSNWWLIVALVGLMIAAVAIFVPLCVGPVVGPTNTTPTILTQITSTPVVTVVIVNGSPSPAASSTATGTTIPDVLPTRASTATLSPPASATRLPEPSATPEIQPEPTATKPAIQKG